MNYVTILISFFREMLEKIAMVTIDDLKKIGPMFIAPLFDSSRVRTAVCCNSSKVQEITHDFKE